MTKDILNRPLNTIAMILNLTAGIEAFMVNRPNAVLLHFGLVVLLWCLR